MTKARVWIVSELFYPEQTSTGYFLTEIGKGLAEHFDVQVICGQPSYSERGIKAPKFELWRGIAIRRVLSTHFDKDRLLLRMVNAATFAFSCIFNALFRIGRNDTVLVVTNPPIVYPLIVLICRMRGARVLLLIHDVYPDILWATDILRRERLLFRFLDKLFIFPIVWAHYVIVLGRDMQDLICRKSGRDKSEVVIIPNWGDGDEIIPISQEHNTFAVAHGLQDKITIQFSGNIGRTHDVDVILKAASLTAENLHIGYIFVGYGGGSSTIRRAISTKAFQNISFLPRQTREMLGPMLASATAVVIAFNDRMLGLSVPSRMYNVLAAGTPIIVMADPASELAMTVADGDCGWIIPMGDSAKLAELAMWLTTEQGRGERARKAENARKLAIERFRFDQVLTQYLRLLEGEVAE
jgi:colanic acid biosynthesis glycosyl transferase WcaI